MKVLYISDRQQGGIVSHVKCLTACLPDDVERYVIGVDGDEPFAGKSGHDWREWFQIRRVIKTFKPDVIHFHTNPLFMELYVKIVRLLDLRLLDCWIGGRKKSNNQTIKQSNNRIRVVCSIHTPSVTKHPEFSRRLVNWAAEPCYWLPVSDDNWRSFKTCYPKAKGEVFYNPIKVEKFKSLKVEKLKVEELKSLKVEGKGNSQAGKSSDNSTFQPSTFQPSTFQPSTFQPFNFTVGMVGRNADQKDWPSFHRVEELVKEQVVKLKGLKVEELKGGRVQEELAERKVEEWLTGVTRTSFVATLEALVQEKEKIGEYRFKRTEEKVLALNGAKRFFDEFSRKIISLSDGRCVYFTPDARSKGRNGGDLPRCWAEYAFHAVSNGGRRLEGKNYNERWYHPHKAANFGQLIATLKSERCFVRLRDDAKNDAILFFGDVASGLSFDVVTRLDEFGNMDANLTEVTFEVASRREKKPPRLVPLTEAVQTVVHHQTTAGSYPSNADNIPNVFTGCKGAETEVEKLNGLKVEKVKGSEVVRGVEFLNAGEKEVCNGREAIAKMDLFVMTSKHEQLPTTVLECFMLGTPICGFLPAGGTSDILQYSKGPVRDAFIKERSCEKLADIVMDLMAHPEKRRALVEDGRQILEGHFDAEKNVRGRLMEVYEGKLKG